MQYIYDISVWLHVSFGMLTLILFWSQAFITKGSNRHITLGRMYIISGVIVSLSSIYSILYQAITTISAGKQLLLSNSDFAFALVLGFISIVVLLILHRGYSAAKQVESTSHVNVRAMYIRLILSFCATIIMVGLILFVNSYWQVIFILTALLGTKITIDEAYILRNHVTFNAGDWTAEHFRGMIGAGLAFHVAFGINGFLILDSLISYQQTIGLLIIVLPLILGIPAEMLLRRKYKTKRSEI